MFFDIELMPTFAMVVVVEADCPEEAYELVACTGAPTEALDEVQFVGEPWPVEPIDGSAPGELPEPEFGTIECIEQHAEFKPKPKRKPKPKADDGPRGVLPAPTTRHLGGPR